MAFFPLYLNWTSRCFETNQSLFQSTFEIHKFVIMRSRKESNRLLAKRLERRMKRNMNRVKRHVEVYETKRQNGDLTENPKPSSQFIFDAIKNHSC